MHDTPIKTKKFPKVNQVPVKYDRKMTNIIKKHASLNSIVPILAKKFVLYCRCSLNAYFRNCKYFFILYIIEINVVLFVILSEAKNP